MRESTACQLTLGLRTVLELGHSVAKGCSLELELLSRLLRCSSPLFKRCDFGTQTPELVVAAQARQIGLLELFLDLVHLQQALQRMAEQPWDLMEPQAVTPMALPLMVERLREQLSTEKLSARLERMLAQAEGVLAHDARVGGKPVRRRRALKVPAG